MKMNGWKMSNFLLGPGLFSEAKDVSFREGNGYAFLAALQTSSVQHPWTMKVEKYALKP